MRLSDDEAPLSEPFWMLDGVEDRMVGDILRRRFPESYDILTECLDEADPLDIVYPDNPGEYSDVVREIIVLLAHVNGALDRVSVDDLDEVVREGLARRFGELPDDERVDRAVGLIRDRVSRKIGPVDRS